MQVIEIFDKIIIPLITSFGTIATILVGVFNYKRTRWSENVSKERMEWIKSFRIEVGKIMKAYAVIKNTTQAASSSSNQTTDTNTNKPANLNINPQIDIESIKTEAEEARYMLITRINTNIIDGNEYNPEYKKILQKLDFNNVSNFPEKRFMELTNIILEAEWQKVKKEAKGEKTK